MRSTASLEPHQVEPSKPALGDLLAQDEYVRRRLQPRLRDDDFLVLKDLHELVGRLAGRVEGRVFDFGCGAAPYRGLFQNCQEYVGADVTPGPNVDRLLGPGGMTGEPDASYDLVLSTQVLEHVADPARYLRECCRILKPGGQLFLSTHGFVEEHGCPDDYYRWTSRGLESLLASHGWRVLESNKFTTEFRAIVQLVHQYMDHLRRPPKPRAHFLRAILRRLYVTFGVPTLNWLAERLPQQAIVPGAHSASLYIGVSVRAERPELGCG